MKSLVISAFVAMFATTALATERGYEPPARSSDCFVLEKHKKKKVRPAVKQQYKPYRVYKVRLSYTIEERWKQQCSIKAADPYMTIVIWDGLPPLLPVELTSIKLARIKPAYFNPPFFMFEGYPQDGVVSAVPEPHTWAMMILGFGLVGSIARRKRNDLYRSL